MTRVLPKARESAVAEADVAVIGAGIAGLTAAALLSRHGHKVIVLERAFPQLPQGIEVKLSGSPRTFQRFTLRSGGTEGGLPKSRAFATFNAPSHRIDIRGLYLAGDTVFPGQGLSGTTVSGFNAARSAARKLTTSGSRVERKASQV